METSSCDAGDDPHGACERRELLRWGVALAAASLGGPLGLAQAQAESLLTRRYHRTRLVDRYGDPFKAAQLAVGEPYLFHYPYRTTPVFLIALPEPAAAFELADAKQQAYRSLPGIGARRSIVAYSAICAHKLMYPTPAISFINIRKGQAGEPAHVVHCCGDNSRYDPTHGGKVIGGPAPQPLAMIELDWNPASDELHAVGTLGGEMFQAFFEKYEFRLNLDHGPQALAPSGDSTVCQPAATYSRQQQSCKA